MARPVFPPSIATDFEIHEWKHASAILRTDFPSEWKDIIDVLGAFRVKKSHVVVGGGGKSKIAQELDAAFVQRGWVEKKWDTKIVVDQRESSSPTHKVDCYKNRVALELEWSNKDPFFDRDLNNFRSLFDLRVISVGIIITKSDELREVFTELGLWNKYGTTTTWMSKLLPRIEGGGGGGCPVLVFAITKRRYDANAWAKRSRVRPRTISGQVATDDSARSWPTRLGVSPTEPEKWRRSIDG